MKFRVVTVGREFGCGSSDLALQLAERLQWRLLDRELIDEIARAAHLDPGACRHLDERLEGWLHRIGKNLWNAAGEKGPALASDPAPDADRMAELSRRVIEDVSAAGNCVIVGRGGNYVLQHRRDVFHLFVYATAAWRVQRLEGQGQARAAAEALVARMDHERSAYIRRYFNQEWARRHHYHLLVNAALGPEAALDAALAAMQSS